MRRLGIVLVLCLLGVTLQAQTIPGTGSGGMTGLGAASRCALFNGTVSLTSDSGCTYTGTGNSFALLSSQFKTVGTGGNGYLELANQTAAPGAPSANKNRLYSDAVGRFCWIGNNGFVRCLDGTAITADRVYVLPDAGGTVSIETGQPVGTGTITADNWRVVSSCTYSNSTGVTTTTTAEELAYTCTIKGNTLTRDGISTIRITASGLKSANGNSITSRIRWGGLAGTVLANVTSTSNGPTTAWTLQTRLTRLTATTQRAVSSIQACAASSTALVPATAGLTLSSDNDLVVTLATATLAGDDTLTDVLVEALN